MPSENVILLLVVCVMTVVEVTAAVLVILFGPNGRYSDGVALLVGLVGPVMTALIGLVRQETTRAAVQAHTGESVHDTMAAGKPPPPAQGEDSSSGQSA